MLQNPHSLGLVTPSASIAIPSLPLIKGHGNQKDLYEDQNKISMQTS
jgi:hypothetical protein